MKKIYLALATIFFGLSLLTFAAPVAAQDIFKDVCKNNSTSATCETINNSKKNGSNPLIGESGMLTKITRVIAIITGLCAVIVSIVSGILYMTAAGDAQKTAKAKSALIGVVIGLAIAALASTIIMVIVARL